jgi:hypothetical protein
MQSSTIAQTPSIVTLQRLNASLSPRRRPPTRPLRRPSPSPRAALYHLPDDVVGAVQTAAAVGMALGLGLSALPILTGESKERNARRWLHPSEEESSENFRWAVMAVLSAIPFISPMVRKKMSINISIKNEKRKFLFIIHARRRRKSTRGN